MPLLLEDLAEDVAAALGRTAERFDAAAKELDCPGATAGEVAQFARHLTISFCKRGTRTPGELT